jgi:pyruvate/2-oxoacid:ferredoxin oxidoreductase beta subunit/Pyruvate/2-oxoacid:ferredoxin oxidoreductase gamma subunit
VTTLATDLTTLETFRNALPYPFCPGCGHGSVLDRLDEALRRLGRDAARTVIVSDIGCSGLSDQYFVTNAFHGLHGRSITYASGIKLADPSLEVIVLMGDGSAGIGGAHLLAAARRNVGITVVVMNNLNFGMTGGQHSTTTPTGAVTATTPGGNPEQPLDICATVAVNGAAFAHRATQWDDDLADRLVEAIETPGFALLDVWELCTAYFVKGNRLSRSGMRALMEERALRPGTVVRREVAEYASAYRRAHRTDAPPAPLLPLPVEHTSALDRPCTIVVAGSAGGRVRSATRLVGEAAVRCGLWATQRDDYPVTVQTGHSVTQLLLAPTPQPLAAVDVPQVVLVLSEDGRRRVGAMLRRLPPEATVVTVRDLVPIDTPAQVTVVGSTRADRREPALAVLTTAVTRLGILPVEALRSAASAGPHAEPDLAAIDAGASLPLA